jgi:MFS family permease
MLVPSWAPASNGSIPPGAHAFGYEAPDPAKGAPLFVCRANYQGGLHPGKVVAMGLLSLITIPLSGHLSDRIGRKRMYLIGAVVTAIYGFIYFGMLNSLVPALIFLGIMLSRVPLDMMYGPQAALIAECFTPRLR